MTIQSHGYEFRDSTGLATWAVRFVLGCLVLSCVATVSGYLEYELLVSIRDGTFDPVTDIVASAEASDTRQAVVGLLQALTYLAAGVLSLRWIHRANTNARALGAEGLQITPGWAIAWYFIPVMNLWKPYGSMKEIWQANANPRDWQITETPRLLAVWWTFWIVSSLLGNASFRAMMRAEELPALISTNVLTLASDIVSIPLCMTFAVIIRRIQEMQMTGAAAATLATAGDVQPAAGV